MAAIVDPRTVVDFSSWKDFKSNLFDRLSAVVKPVVGGSHAKQEHRLLFRGQACGDWSLRSSFDRLMEQHHITGKKIEEIYSSSLEEFYNNGREMNLFGDFSRVGITDSFPVLKGDNDKLAELEGYAQHYGFPTRLLDWSASPYISAFFAASGWEACSSGSLAVWCLNVPVAREIFDEHDLVIRDRFLDSERRQIWQRASFTVNRTNLTRLDDVFDPANKRLRDDPAAYALIKCTIPVHDAQEMLQDLDFMRINHLSVYPDVDGLVRYSIYKLATKHF